jgi:hypothetical protein
MTITREHVINATERRELIVVVKVLSMVVIAIVVNGPNVAMDIVMLMVSAYLVAVMTMMMMMSAQLMQSVVRLAPISMKHHVSSPQVGTALSQTG